MTRLKRMFEKEVVRGWVIAPAILLIIGGLMLLFSGATEASQLDLRYKDNGWFARPAYVYLGLEYDKGQACVPNAMTPVRSNMGFGVNLFAHHGLEINLQYTHHSCAFDLDYRVQDTGGIMVKWYPGVR
jgi:hypothetical protein